MWKQLIAPTLLVAGLWVIMSLATTYFIVWLDGAQEQALARMRDTSRPAEVISENVWRLVSYSGSSGAPDRQQIRAILPSVTQRVDRELRSIQLAATTDNARTLATQLDSQWKNVLGRISDTSRGGEPSVAEIQQLRSAAEEITGTVDQFRAANEKLMGETHRQLDRWKFIVLSSRFIVLIIGPAVGIALGWTISKRLHRSISEINIILKDAGYEMEENIGKLRMSAGEDLPAIRERVENIISRLRQVNAELEMARTESLRSERLAAVGELAAGVAHELRNPLTSVKLLLQNAAQQPGQTMLNDEETCVMLDEILRMENTIQGLLDFSRPASPKRQRHDLRDTLQRGLNLVQGRARQNHVQIETHLPGCALMVDGDPEQLHQVFVNLLINGIEAKSEASLELQVAENLENRTARISIRDFGPGIPPQVLAHLFEPFVSNKERGTGLGLAISRRIVRQHGGTLEAQNHQDGGAILTVELPLTQEPNSRQPDAVANRETISSSR